MSTKRIVIAIVAALVAGAGGAAVGYVFLRNTPAGQAVADTVGLPRAYTQADVDAALLTLADLPGYSLAPADENDDDDSSATNPCGRSFKFGDGAQKATLREFEARKSAFGPFVFHGTGLVEGGTTLDGLRSVFKDCPSWTDPDGDEVTAVAANYGMYGDETFSIKLMVEAEELGIGMAIVVIRKGNLVSMLGVAGFPDVNGDEVMALAAKAAVKLPA